MISRLFTGFGPDVLEKFLVEFFYLVSRFSGQGGEVGFFLLFLCEKRYFSLTKQRNAVRFLITAFTGRGAFRSHRVISFITNKFRLVFYAAGDVRE